jgi:SAM-dependent methyltransferase
MTSFDELVAEAVAAPFSGWDLSWLRARSSATDLPWCYREEVARHCGTAGSMLDMGTGGGEWLSRLALRPARTVATESWPPNVGVAASRLAPLGVPVVHCDGAPDNMSEAAAHPAGQGLLPFRDGAFQLVINQHEAFRADEVFRVLAAGGTFVTQQVDSPTDEALYRLLGLDPPDATSWLPLATAQLTSADLTVTAAAAAEKVMSLHDVGAAIYYLKVISWAVPGYRLESFLPRLRQAFADARAWPLKVAQRRFLVVATKPGG